MAEAAVTINQEKSRVFIKWLHRTWIVEKGGDLEALWEEMAESNPDERIPYWIELWPSSLALADWLHLKQKDIEKQPCVDLGCGLGFTAMAGQAAGATVTAIDYESAALRYCNKNFELNGLPAPTCVLMDWRQPALRKSSVSHLWAADIIYEKRFFEPVLNFLDYCLEANGVAWIAEPGRTIFMHFLQMAAEKGWESKQVFERKVTECNNESNPATVSVWELSRKKS